jgi:hypothetical protein
VQKMVEYLLLAGEKSSQHQAAYATCEFFEKALKKADIQQIDLDPETEANAHKALALANMDIGDMRAASKEAEKAVEICRQQGMIEDEMDNLSWLAFILWLTSIRGEEGLRYCDEGIARAREVKHKATESFLLGCKGFFRAPWVVCIKDTL